MGSTINNRDDSDELHDRIDGVKEKTPDIKMLFTDGGYGSEENDIKLADLEIEQVQTAIRGRDSSVDIAIVQDSDGTIHVTCPLQTGEVQKTKTGWKAVMSKSACQTCPMREQCPSHKRKNGRMVYFQDKDIARHARHRRIKTIPAALRSLRANVEATMREFSRRLEGGKLKFRGLLRAELFGLTTAIGINFGREYRYVRQ